MAPSWRNRNRPATVTSFVKGQSTAGNPPLSRPLFGYHVDGQAYEHASSTAQYPPAYKVGEMVEIFYLKHDPGQAMLRAETDIRPLCFMGVGFLLAGVAAFLFGDIGEFWWRIEWLLWQ